MPVDDAQTLGVVGAGAMGAGIAQLGCQARMRTLLFDVDEPALARGVERVRTDLAKAVERGRMDASDAEAVLALLEPTTDLDRLGACDLIIEAVPEDLEIKRETFERLSALGDDIVLASNTSSLTVGGIASAATRPERVVGMHFFNPPARMKLVEIVAGPDSSPDALELARAVGRAMDRHPIDTRDTPGFIVNRCLRPFYSEALKLLEEGIAGHEQIDRIVRLGGGYRMGPFELLDLVGLDVNLAVTRSFFDQSSGEPRWKPSTTQARLVASGRLGRKSGQGFYDYGDDAEVRDEPVAPAIGNGAGLVVLRGTGALAAELAARAENAGYDVSFDPDDAAGADLLVDLGNAGLVPDLSAAGSRILLCATRSLAAAGATDAAGFNLLPVLGPGPLVELTSLPTTPQPVLDAAEAFFANLGFITEWVRDAPGLVLGRIVAQLVNEAAFAISEGVGTAEDLDTGVVLGLNHPHGPVEWGRLIGLDTVLATLEGLWHERQEERYRAAPLLREAVATSGELRVAPLPRPTHRTSGGTA